jgi:malate dehydrogenase
VIDLELSGGERAEFNRSADAVKALCEACARIAPGLSQAAS